VVQYQEEVINIIDKIALGRGQRVDGYVLEILTSSKDNGYPHYKETKKNAIQVTIDGETKKSQRVIYYQNYSYDDYSTYEECISYNAERSSAQVKTTAGNIVTVLLFE
jgi:hypothetical protein